MKKKSSIITNEQAFIYYVARVIYNFSDSKYDYIVNSEVNIFRNDKNSLFANISKSSMEECENIADAIEYKTLVDRSIISEINIIPKDKICNFSYTNNVKLNNCTSNPEVHYFSKTNGLHIAKVESLSSYEKMDFTCWKGVTNLRIQEMLKGEEVSTNEESIALSQTLSLFLCESSRNPVSFFTAPMCFELSEYWSNILITEWTTKKSKLNVLNEIPLNIRKDLTTETVISDIDVIIKKNIILEYFPMVQGKAVAASRYISNKINKVFLKLGIDNLFHKYDNDTGSIDNAIELINKENLLINEWEAVFKYSVMDKKVCSNFIDEWYGITLEKNDVPNKETLGDIVEAFEI